MILLVAVALIIWSYVLSVLRRAELPAFYFVWGSSGMLVFMMIFIQPFLQSIFVELICIAVKAIYENFNGIKVSYQDSSLFLRTTEDIMSITVGYELSGIIEFLAFSAMLWFFPLFSFVEKLVWQIVCGSMVYIAAVLRLVAVTLCFVVFGNAGTLFGSVFLGRIIFYSLIVTLYFVCFTGKQVRVQRLGGGAPKWR